MGDCLIDSLVNLPGEAVSVQQALDAQWRALHGAVESGGAARLQPADRGGTGGAADQMVA